MAETLGSLCDKLTVVKLKQWHANEDAKRNSLSMQQGQLEEEIDQFIENAVAGVIPSQRLTFAANKVYAAEGNAVADINGSVGQIVSRLATVNCQLWHEQEKVYAFEKVPVEEKDRVVKRLAHLNLERTRCIDEIDKNLCDAIRSMDSYSAKFSGGRTCI